MALLARPQLWSPFRLMNVIARGPVLCMPENAPRQRRTFCAAATHGQTDEMASALVCRIRCEKSEPC